MLLDSIRPLSQERCITPEEQKENQEKWKELGTQAIRRNQVAVLILAGGQATRLGSDVPKGMYKLDLGNDNECQCLFDIQADCIKRRQWECGNSTIHWYVMLSKATEMETKKYFIQKQFWGLDSGQVHFFLQSDLPVSSLEDESFYDSQGNIITSPSGNGAVFKALVSEKILQDMQNRGIRWICQYGVDNILADLAEPVSLGCMIDRNVDILCKTILKSRIDEPVGQVVEQWSVLEKKWKISVIEYSEMSIEMRNELYNKNYPGGHVCMNIFKTNFLTQLLHESFELPKHRALKKIPHSGNSNPQQPNGYKFEMFIFDIFEFTDSFLIFEVNRNLEFAPLKNSSESSEFDNPKECVRKYLLVKKQKYVDT